MCRGLSLGLSLVFASVSLGCARSAERDAAAPSWAVSDKPILSLGDSAAPRGHEFNGISTALRLRDHSVLVVNSGARELELFDSLGRFQRTIGRKGQGPGEYQGPMSAFAWRADSIAVYDPAIQRWTILDPGLTASRTTGAPDSTLLQPTWLYQGAMVADGVLQPVPGWAASVLDSVRSRDPKFEHLIRARRDDVGALWIQDRLDENTWAVYTKAGSPAGTVRLPPHLAPIQIGADFVLGLVHDSLGVEGVRLHSLDRPRGGQPGPDGQPAPLPKDPTILAGLPNLLIAQEQYYAGHGKYAARADSLSLRSPPPYRLFILGGDGGNWAGVGVRPETGATCGVSVGWPSPSGWLDGTPFCGR